MPRWLQEDKKYRRQVSLWYSFWLVLSLCLGMFALSGCDGSFQSTVQMRMASVQYERCLAVAKELFEKDLSNKCLENYKEQMKVISGSYGLSEPTTLTK